LSATVIPGAERSQDKVLRNSFFLMVSTLLMAGLGFVFWVVVARLYSPAEVGLATSLIAASTLIAYVSQLGLNNTLVRFRAPGAAHSAEVTQYCVVVGLVACVVASLYLVGLQWYGRKLLFIETHPVQALAFVLFCSCTALALLTDAIFIAERKTEYTVATDGLVQSLTKLALPAVLVGSGAFGIFAATGVGYAAGVLASFFLMYWKLGLRPRLLVRGTSLVEQVRFSLATYAASLLNLAPLLVIPLIVLQRRGEAQAGFYFLAFQIATLLNSVAYAIGEALFAEASNDLSRFGHLLRRSALLMGAAQIPAAAVVALGAGTVLRLFGQQYAAQGRTLLIVLACGSVAVGLYTWASYALKVARRLKHLMIGNVVYAVVIIGLAAVWAPRGLVWLGWAWTLGNLAAGLYCAIALAVTWPAAPIAGGPLPPAMTGTGRDGSGRDQAPALGVNLSAAGSGRRPPGRTILLVSPYFPPHVGGVETYVFHLARHLEARHGYRVLVATTADGSTSPGRDDGPDGTPVYRLRVLGQISNTPIGVGWCHVLRALIASEHVDLVNAHAPAPLFADAAARAARDVPFVLTYHTGRMRRGRQPVDSLLAGYERVVLAKTAHRARELICCSDYVAADQPSLFGGRSTTIAPGVDLTCFTPSALPQAPRVLFVGSLEPATAYKGLADLLRSVARLAGTRPGVELDVVGSGAAMPEYAALAQRLGIAERVRFHGRLDSGELAQAYRRARILALPTSFDAFPCVLVEAMACARPVVTTPIGGIPSLVSHRGNGLLVPPGDIEALTSALDELLGDDALARRLGEAGRERVAAEFSWESQADRTAALFERVLAS
jgi:glycosyltransferase involved in cell wall biosynthesis/O-antigen/teichoic acid export membrane protein